MHISSIKIKNFRALEDIQVDFDRRVNVIVGPNAAGKTTILEAVRVVKALLAPRQQSEATQVLLALGAASPHQPNRIRVAAIARDPAQDVVVGCRFKLSAGELAELAGAVEVITRGMAQAQLGQAFASAEALLPFLASPQGVQLLEQSRKAVVEGLARVQASATCHLEVTFSTTRGISATSNPLDIQFVSFLERRFPPHKTGFTYFPADRALPTGEQPVQLGAADAAQQVESYNSQPQLKFARLKNTIFGASVLGDESASSEALEAQFAGIFSGILKGRELVKFGVNEIGLLSVLIKDVESGRTFDMDGMSSGEKGLILTCLLISRTVHQDGLVLLDEPELHLNPAVCKDLLTYLVDQYIRPNNLQILMCSHSPEILAGTFDNDECSLFHLVSSKTLSKVRPQDEATLSEALRRLGSSESENLLYRGVVFVEGPDDVALLEASHGPLLRRYKLKYSTGRKEIEKAIIALQAAENEGRIPEPTYFIFDRDETPTTLRSSLAARVLQWDRRCYENYLLDLDALADVLMDEDIVRAPLSNHGEVSRLLRELALRQLDEIALRNVYSGFAFVGVGLRREDVTNKSVEDAATTLLGRLEQMKAQLLSVDETTWRDDFLARVAEERKRLESTWDSRWVFDCDGKRLLDDISKSIQLRVNIRRLKIRLARQNALNQSESWKVVQLQLSQLLQG